jgi:hypothetical protein
MSTSRRIVESVLSACVACHVLLAPGVSAQEPSVADGQNQSTTVDPDKLAEAKQHFQLGLNHLRDPEGERIEPAYLEFKRTYELSGSPRVLGNIGYCAMKLELYDEAVAAYREYIAKVPGIDPVERQQIDQDLVMMTTGATTLVVRFSGPGEWTLLDERIPVQGASVKNSYGPYAQETSLLIHPGHHLVRLFVDNEEQGSFEFNSTSSQTQSHGFEPRPPEPVKPEIVASPQPAPVSPPPSAPPASYLAPIVTLSVGGAMLVGGAVTGLLALGKMKDLEKRCPNDTCEDDGYKSDVNSSRTLGTVTDVLLFGGGAVAVGGATWLLLTRSSNSVRALAKHKSITAYCGPGKCSLGVRGRF